MQAVAGGAQQRPMALALADQRLRVARPPAQARCSSSDEAASSVSTSAASIGHVARLRAPGGEKSSLASPAITRMGVAPTRR